MRNFTRIPFRDFTRVPIRFDRLFLLDKAKWADGMFHASLVLAFFTTSFVWFFVNLYGYATLLAAMLAVGAFILRLTMRSKESTNPRYLPLAGLTALLTLYFSLIRGDSFGGVLGVVLLAVVYSFMYRADGVKLKATLTLIQKIMAVVLLASLATFAMYLMGFPLPSGSFAVEGRNYSYANFYTLLIFEWDLWLPVPRFQSVFLEPSHMAIAACLLLMTDIGRWKKWYNIVMLVAILLSFSAEAYVLLVMLFFLSKWIMRKNFVRNMLILFSVFALIIGGSFIYNGGDNLLNNLIVARFEVEDGEVAGDNRVTDEFQAEYEGYLQSSDIVFGRVYNGEMHSSGYKVFFYNNGIVGLLLLFSLYAFILCNPKNKRPALTAALIMLVHFVIRAHMTWGCVLLTAYYMSWWYKVPNTVLEEKE